MKDILLPLLLLLALESYGQDDVYFNSKERARTEAPVLPTKEGVIFYEEVVEIGSGKKKDDLYRAAREWFVETYNNAESVLQLDDKEDGKLMGKALYTYSVSSRFDSERINLKFILNLDIRDGKYRYRIYSFGGTVEGTAPNKINFPRSVDFDGSYRVAHIPNEVIEKMKKKEQRETKEVIEQKTQIIIGLDREVKSIIGSLKAAMAKAESSDW
jgi:hypothetical protein